MQTDPNIKAPTAHTEQPRASVDTVLQKPQAPAIHPAHSAKPGKLLRLPATEERCGLKKSTIYAGVKAGTFPAPVRLSARAVAFREEDIDRWISERIKTGGQS